MEDVKESLGGDVVEEGLRSESQESGKVDTHQESSSDVSPDLNHNQDAGGEARAETSVDDDDALKAGSDREDVPGPDGPSEAIVTDGEDARKAETNDDQPKEAAEMSVLVNDLGSSHLEADVVAPDRSMPIEPGSEEVFVDIPQGRDAIVGDVGAEDQSLVVESASIQNEKVGAAFDPATTGDSSDFAVVEEEQTEAVLNEATEESVETLNVQDDEEIKSDLEAKPHDPLDFSSAAAGPLSDGVDATPAFGIDLGAVEAAIQGEEIFLGDENDRQVREDDIEQVETSEPSEKEAEISAPSEEVKTSDPSQKEAPASSPTIEESQETTPIVPRDKVDELIRASGVDEESVLIEPSASPRNEDAAVDGGFEPLASPRAGDGQEPLSSPRARDVPFSKQSMTSSSNQTVGMKRPLSSTRLELSSAKEESINALLSKGVDLEHEFVDLVSNPNRPMEIHLIQQLLAAGGTARMLGALFRRMVEMHRPDSTVDDFANLPRLIRSARIGTAVRSRGPGRTFCFSGKDTCIEVSGTSTFAKSFPSSWGISLWLWISPRSGPFTLASFLTKERYGVSVTVIPPDDSIEGRTGTLLFESADEKKRDGLRVSFPSGTMKLRTWHHLYIHHSRKKYGSAMGTMVVRMDDREVADKPLGFPGLGLTSPVTRARIMEEFEGFTGPIWVLDGPLKSPASLARQQVSPVLAEGEEAAPGIGVFLSRSDQEQHPPVFASYYPERTVGKLCLDLHGSHLGTLMNASAPWTLPCARDSLRAVGGATLFLPFLQDRSLLTEGRHPPSVVAEVVLQTLLLLGSFLEGHSPNQTEFYDANGVALIAQAMERLSKPVKEEMLRDPSRDLVSALGSVARAFGLDAIGTASEGTRLMRMINWRPRSVEYELDRQLILNLSFWIRFSEGIHHSLLTRLVALCAKRVQERPAAYRKRFGMLFFLDVLRRMY